MNASGKAPERDLWQRIQDRLEGMGLDLEQLLGADWASAVKVVCVAPDIKESLREMGRSHRDQVVMVRVDGETSRKLDAWVETGAVRSRSEAAALFIREGLKVRDGELEQLRDVLDEVESAKSRLQERVRAIFGEEDGAEA